MQEFFLVGGSSLAFLPESCVTIDDDFYVELWGRGTTDPGELWTDSQDKIGFRLRFQGVCCAGVPTAEANFEQGRSSNFSHYLWEDGWACGLVFTGSAVLSEGWLEMVGEMAPRYSPSPRAQLRLRWPLPLEGLDWSRYRFGSLQETHGIDPALVNRLEVVDLATESLPERILEFRNLRSLRLRGLPLLELPPAFTDLTQLEELQIFAARLSELPDGFERLQALSWLQVSRCRLDSTPDQLWSLPALRHLDLSHNQLIRLPENVHLPALRELDLTDNQLTTLPEGLARLPGLKRILLDGNRLSSLPTAFESVRIELPLADKMRLLDFGYRGAHGRGVVEWDDSVYRATVVPPGAPVGLRELALHSLALKPVETTPSLGATRFGGWPDLPVGIDYPRYELAGKEYHYEFIAQLDCAELAEQQGYLPRAGRLYFFLSNVHELGPLVLYSQSNELADGKSLTLAAEQFYDTLEVPYPGLAVEVSSALSLPSGYAAGSNPHLFEGVASELAEQGELLDELREQYCVCGCHEVNCHVFTQHESPQLQAALSYRGHPRDWVVLLKVASLGGFQWGDAGELFYVIHKSDLARADFSAIYCTSESS